MIKQRKIQKYNIFNARTTILFSVLVFVISFVAMPSIYAYSSYKYDFEVIQSIKMKGAYSEPHFPIYYSLTAENKSSPLPSGSKDGNYEFNITGNASKSLSIDYILPGEYSYILYQKEPKKGFGYSHDASVYRIYVLVTESSSGLVAKTTFRRDGDSYKPLDLSFDNNFTPSSTSVNSENSRTLSKYKVPKTGDINNIKLWIVVFFLSGIFLFIIFMYKRKDEDEDDTDNHNL